MLSQLNENKVGVQKEGHVGLKDKTNENVHMRTQTASRALVCPQTDTYSIPFVWSIYTDRTIITCEQEGVFYLSLVVSKPIEPVRRYGDFLFSFAFPRKSITLLSKGHLSLLCRPVY